MYALRNVQTKQPTHSSMLQTNSQLLQPKNLIKVT